MRYEPDEIIRTKRKTLSLEIKKDGRFVVHAPLRISEHEINEFIDLKQAWIAETLEKCSIRVSKVLDVDFSRGSAIPFLGHMIRLDYHDKRSMKLAGADMINRLPGNELSDFNLLEDVTLFMPSPEFRMDGADQRADLASRIHDLPGGGNVGIQFGGEDPLEVIGVLRVLEFRGDQGVVEEDVVEHDPAAGDVPRRQFLRVDDDEGVLSEREFAVADDEEAAAFGDEGDLPELPLETPAQVEVFGAVRAVADREGEVVPEK